MPAGHAAVGRVAAVLCAMCATTPPAARRVTARQRRAAVAGMLWHNMSAGGAHRCRRVIKHILRKIEGQAAMYESRQRTALCALQECNNEGHGVFHAPAGIAGSVRNARQRIAGDATRCAFAHAAAVRACGARCSAARMLRLVTERPAASMPHGSVARRERRQAR